MTCIFKDCGRKVFARQYCQQHYKQFRQGRDLVPLQTQHHGLTEYDRFFKRVCIGDAGNCWEWTGSRNKTHWHGQWRNQEGEIELAHRAAWRLMVGAIPVSTCILHKCDNPICCNPSHLFLGSQSDNARDMWNKHRAKPGTSKGEKHGMSVLTERMVRSIRSSKAKGVDLAKRFNVTPTTICDIRKNRIWKHLT